MFQGAGSFSPLLPDLSGLVSARSSVPFPASWTGYFHHPKVIRPTNTSRGVPAFRESHLIGMAYRRNAKTLRNRAFVSILSAPWQNDHVLRGGLVRCPRECAKTLKFRKRSPAPWRNTRPRPRRNRKRKSCISFMSDMLQSQNAGAFRHSPSCTSLGASCAWTGADKSHQPTSAAAKCGYSLARTMRPRLLPSLRRGGRVVEGARLLSGYTVKSRIVGSNPILSARPLAALPDKSTEWPMHGD